MTLQDHAQYFKYPFTKVLKHRILRYLVTNAPQASHYKEYGIRQCAGCRTTLLHPGKKTGRELGAPVWMAICPTLIPQSFDRFLIQKCWESEEDLLRLKPGFCH
jgi:hypothetical protein